MFKKKYYWYQVNFKYTNNNAVVFYWNEQVGLTKQNSVINSRLIKKIVKPLHLKSGVQQRLLCFIGKFSK